MKLIRIQLSQAARIIAFGNDRGGVYWPDAIAALQTRYGFLEVPKVLRELDAGKGVTFRHGKFQSGDSPVVVDLFQYFPSGIVAQSSATVESTELFLSDLIEFVTSEFDLQTDTQFKNNFVESKIVVKSEINLDALLSVQSTILDFINSETESRGFSNRFVTTGFEIGYDPVAHSRPVLSTFSLHRRINEQFDQNLYYSRAPLTTAAHLSLLEKIEELA